MIIYIYIYIMIIKMIIIIYLSRNIQAIGVFPQQRVGGL